MPQKNKKNPFNKEKMYLLAAATILGVLLVAGENSFLFSQDTLYARVTADNTGTQASDAKPFTGEAGVSDMIFTDIPANHPDATALKYLKDKGIMKGYPDGSFQPDKAINRAELIKIIIVALGEPKDIGTHKNCFTDVKEEWFAPYGCYAKWKGWVKGYGDGGYHPSSDVTRSEALKMMLAAYGTKLETSPMTGSSFTDLTADQWFAPYVWTAEKLGITSAWKDNTAANLNNKATRLEVATAIYQLETTGSQTPTI
jgi:hypothetical protein